MSGKVDLDKVLEEFHQFAENFSSPDPPQRSDSVGVVESTRQNKLQIPKSASSFDRRGSQDAVRNLDFLMADIKSFHSNKDKNNNNNNIQNQIDNRTRDASLSMNNNSSTTMDSNTMPTKANNSLEDEVDDLTDKLVRSFQGEDTDIFDEAESEFGNCKKCGKRIRKQSVLAGKDNYHQECFVCKQCNKSLLNNYFLVNGENYCEEHKLVAVDKCKSCGDHILEGAIIINKKDKFHPECFACAQCKQPISGNFFTTDDGDYVCETDYKETKDKCFHCHLPIIDRTLTALNKKFHPACFRCSLCDRGLDGVPFVQDGNAINCKDCYSRYKAKQCCVCSEGIVSSPERKTSLITCNGKSYHEECYNCQDCKKSLKGEYCYAAGEDVMCVDCNLKRIGTNDQ